MSREMKKITYAGRTQNAIQKSRAIDVLVNEDACLHFLGDLLQRCALYFGCESEIRNNGNVSVLTDKVVDLILSFDEDIVKGYISDLIEACHNTEKYGTLIKASLKMLSTKEHLNNVYKLLKVRLSCAEKHVDKSIKQKIISKVKSSANKIGKRTGRFVTFLMNVSIFTLEEVLKSMVDYSIVGKILYELGRRLKDKSIYQFYVDLLDDLIDFDDFLGTTITSIKEDDNYGKLLKIVPGRRLDKKLCTKCL